MRPQDNEWTDTYKRTTGADSTVRDFELNGKNIKLQIWDTEGHEKAGGAISSNLLVRKGISGSHGIGSQSSSFGPQIMPPAPSHGAQNGS